MSRIFFLLPLLIITSGCASVSLTELSGAETTPKGQHTIEVNGGISTDITKYVAKYSEIPELTIYNRVFDQSIFPFLELGYKYGISENVDIRANVWTGGFPANLPGNSLTEDIGTKVGIKYRLLEPDSVHNLAWLGSVSYYDFEPNLNRKTGTYLTNIKTLMYSTGLVYSYRVKQPFDKPDRLSATIQEIIFSNTLQSVYTGVKVNFAHSDIFAKKISNGVEIQRYNETGKLVLVSPFLGMLFGQRTVKSFEVQLLTTKNKFTGKIETVPIINFGIAWNL